MEDHLAWFDGFASTPLYAQLKDRPIAYFCAEFALDSRLPTYAGGLGILAGDVVREAGDRGLPFVAVGLFYREAYRFDINGRDPEKCGVTRVTGEDGKPIAVKVPIHDRDVIVHAWRYETGGVSVYLLDTDVSENTPGDRMITSKLYVGEKETRLKQEIVLGIGGLRLLEALGIHPSIHHLNEGHSAMLALELVRHQMKERRLSFEQALQYARRRIIMTNHTIVAAGNETFSNDLVSLLLGRYAEEIQVPVHDLVRLGLVQESSVFSMTMLAFRMTAIINAVSKLHATKAKEIWADHPMAAVTNGVHLPTWDRIRQDAPTAEAMSVAHRRNKENLLSIIKSETGRAWRPGDLLLGWARRFASYKRPLSLIDDVGRFLKIAADAKRPVRVVFAGYAHPSDTEGQGLFEELERRVNGDLKDVACYLSAYDIEKAPYLVSGTDIWLNTPIVGYEACGTSGMKAMLNGSLPCSTRDGWVDEVDLEGIGWLIDSAMVNDDLMRTLEKKIVPAYYDAGDWAERMRRGRELAIERFSATRMLREYLEMLYS